jgi:hypothetical protein
VPLLLVAAKVSETSQTAKDHSNGRDGAVFRLPQRRFRISAILGR